MQRIFKTAGFFLLGLISGIVFTPQGQAFGSDDKIYKFKSAEIELVTTSPMNETRETVQIGEWGKYEKRHTVTKINAFGFKQTQEQITYTDREKNMVYTYDPKTNKATALDISEMMDNAQKNNMYHFNEEALKKWGGEKDGTEKFLGLTCDRVKFSNFGSTALYYKNFPVKMAANFGGVDSVTEAVTFKENVSFSKKDLMLPDNVEVSATEDLGDVMGKMNAYKNSPEYKQSMEQRRANMDQISEQDMEEARKAMEDAGPQMEKAMEALKGLGIFGNE